MASSSSFPAASSSSFSGEVLLADARLLLAAGRLLPFTLGWTEAQNEKSVLQKGFFFLLCGGIKGLDTNKDRRPSLLLWNISWAPLRLEEGPAATAIIHAGKTLLFWAGGVATRWTGFPSSGEAESFYNRARQTAKKQSELLYVPIMLLEEWKRFLFFCFL